MIIRSSVNRKEELKNVNIDLVEDLFSKTIIKNEFKDILEHIFVQDIDEGMTNIMYNNISSISKEEFVKQYEKHKKQGLLSTMIALKIKFK